MILVWNYEILLSVDSITIGGHSFPKFIPDPKYLDEQPLLYKRYFISCEMIFASSAAPEYDQFKDLFHCHSLEADFYVVFPRRSTSASETVPAPVPVPSSAPNPPVKDASVHTVNAFSSSYREEVEGFSITLSALIQLMQTQKDRNLQTLINDSAVILLN